MSANAGGKPKQQWRLEYTDEHKVVRVYHFGSKGQLNAFLKREGILPGEGVRIRQVTGRGDEGGFRDYVRTLRRKQ